MGCNGRDGIWPIEKMSKKEISELILHEITVNAVIFKKEILARFKGSVSPMHAFNSQFMNLFMQTNEEIQR